MFGLWYFGFFLVLGFRLFLGLMVWSLEFEVQYLWFCNDLFSRFEQQILFLEKLSRSMDPTTDRYGHDGPSRGSRSKTLRILKFGY